MKFALALLIWLVASLDARATVVSFRPDTVVADVAQVVSLDVQVSGTMDLFAFQLDISFNPAVLTAQSVVERGFFAAHGAFFNAGFIDNTQGLVTFVGDSLSGPGPGLTGTDSLINIQFVPVGTGVSDLSLENLILLDSNLNDLPFTVESGQITVSPVVTTPEPNTLALLAISVVGLFVTATIRRHVWQCE